MKEMGKRSQLLILLVMIIAAGVAYYLFNRPTTDDIGRQVATLLQQQLDTKEPLNRLHMKVQGVQVVRSEGNHYSGIAHIDLHGDIHDVPVDILYDGDQVMMQVQPGQFMFTAPDLMQTQHTQE